MPAVTDAYETVQGYRAAINKDDTSQDMDIQSDLMAVSRWQDRKLGRFFNQEVTTRQYLTTYSGPIYPEAENPYRYARGSRQVNIDDLVSVTSVLVDLNGDGIAETAYVQDTDYQLWPLNADKGSEPRPFTALIVPPWPQSRLAFPPMRRVDVTGTWGWASVPLAIKRACGQLTAILRMEGSRASRSLTADGEILEANPQAMGIIRELMNVYARPSL